MKFSVELLVDKPKMFWKGHRCVIEEQGVDMWKGLSSCPVKEKSFELLKVIRHKI